MIPTDRRSEHENARAADVPSPSPLPSQKRGTLPPPEWTGAGAERGRREPGSVRAPPDPLARRSGARADEAWMRARVEEARTAVLANAGGASVEARRAYVVLARWLASRDRDLHEAVDLAASALALRDDVELRRDLSAWLESLGESLRAAAALKPIASMPEVESAEAAYVLVRSGILQARAGVAAGAAAAFDAAAWIDPTDPLPVELYGGLAAWPDGGGVSATAASDAYVEAARRRSTLHQDAAALGDLWRAFALGSENEGAADALQEALRARGCPAAADDVWRGHARALIA
ncbi:MAG: hypothetical protein ACREJ3_04290, partial [Polyangiaceae bacterium]